MLISPSKLVCMKTVYSILSGLFIFSIICRAGSEDSTKINSVITGFDYSSNTSSFGRFSSVIRQPSYSAYSSFYSQYGFNLGFSGIAIDNTDSTATKFTQQYNLSAGYDLDFGKYFSLSVLYTHFFYSRNSFSLNSIYKDELSTGLNLNWGKFYTNASLYYMWGDRNEIMNSVNAGVNLDIKDVFIKGHSISISPDLSAMWSNQDYYNQYAFKTYWYLYLLAQRRPELSIQKLYNSPELYPRLWNFLNNHPKKLKEFSRLDKDLIISELFRVNSKYNLSSVSCTIPVYYNAGNFSLNITYSITFPINVPEYLDNSAIHHFSAGLMYSFSL